MQFENVSILIASIANIIRDMNYCWRDRQGHICSQTGAFRVNCIDCLDRTNVVQVGTCPCEMFCAMSTGILDGDRQGGHGDAVHQAGTDVSRETDAGRHQADFPAAVGQQRGRYKQTVCRH